MTLVHERQEGQPTTGVPTVWRRRSSDTTLRHSAEPPIVARMLRTTGNTGEINLNDSVEVPAFLRKQVVTPVLAAVPSPATPPTKQGATDLQSERELLLKGLEALAAAEDNVHAVWVRFGANTNHTASTMELLHKIKQLGVSDTTAWALLLQWLNNFAPGTKEVLTFHGRRVLREAKSNVSESITFKAYGLCLAAWL